MNRIKFEINNRHTDYLLNLLEQQLEYRPEITCCLREGAPDEIEITVEDEKLIYLLEKIYCFAQVRREKGEKIKLKLVINDDFVDFDTLTFDEFKYQLAKKSTNRYRL